MLPRRNWFPRKTSNTNWKIEWKFISTRRFHSFGRNAKQKVFHSFPQGSKADSEKLANIEIFCSSNPCIATSCFSFRNPTKIQNRSEKSMRVRLSRHAPNSLHLSHTMIWGFLFAHFYPSIKRDHSKTALKKRFSAQFSIILIKGFFFFLDTIGL